MVYPGPAITHAYRHRLLFLSTFDALCRAYCTRSQDAATISDDEERVIWIPGRLLVTASRDTEVYSFILDVVFRNGLFSAKLPVQAAARQWGVVYMHSGEHDRSAIMGVLRAKARVQHDVQSFLTIRGKLQSINQLHLGLLGPTGASPLSTQKQ